MKPSPQEIWKSIREVPPYVQEEVAKSYEGTDVRWQLEFWSLKKLSGDKVRLSLYPDANTVTPHVSFNTDTSIYPRLKHLRQKEEVFVTGSIKTVDGAAITLTDDTAVFFDKKEWKAGKQPQTLTPAMSISHSQLHFGSGDNVGGDKKSEVVVKSPRLGIFAQITNNQTFAIVVGGLIVAYLLFQFGISSS